MNGRYRCTECEARFDAIFDAESFDGERCPMHDGEVQCGGVLVRCPKCEMVRPLGSCPGCKKERENPCKE